MQVFGGETTWYEGGPAAMSGRRLPAAETERADLVASPWGASPSGPS